MNTRHHFSHYSGHGGPGIGSILCDVSKNVLLNSIPVFFFFHEQMPFRKKSIQDLYKSICTEKVKHRPQLSKIAWNLLTQVFRQNAE